MKRVGMLLAGGLLVSLLSAGGCVNKSELDKALALNKAAQTELEKTQAALRELRTQNQALLDQIAQYQEQIRAKDAQIASLQKQVDELTERLAGIKVPKAPDPVVIAGTALPRELDELLKALADKYPILEYDPRLGMVKLKADLTFAPGSDDVTAAATEALARFAEIMNTPAAARFNVYIAGHTDDMKIVKQATKERHPNNWYLSVHRAVAVLKVLGKSGIADPRMGAMGFGEYHPIAPNAPGNKGNVANRRVELWVVPPDRFLTSGITGAAPAGGAEAPAAPAAPAAPVAPAAPIDVVPPPPPAPANP